MASEITTVNGYSTSNHETSVSNVIISQKCVGQTVTSSFIKTEDKMTKVVEEEDEFSKFDQKPTINDQVSDKLGEEVGLVKQKSATLTPSSGNKDSVEVDKSPRTSPMGGSANPFANTARNNLRRSFTLPRGLLLRRSGQTGPASENQNGNFVRNIFLTLVRSKSVRKKRQEADLLGDGVDKDKDTEGYPPGFTPAAIGLKNQGNTCFMNAIVQCLSHTDALAKYLVTDNYKSDLRRKNWIKNGKSEVTDELASILKSAWLRQNSTLLEDSVARFKSAVEKGALQWRGSEQHDAQEFCLWLLDRLHEDLNQASSNKYKPVKNNFGRPEEQVAAEALANHLRCNNSIIQDIFGAQFRSSLTCPGCGKQSATFDPFLCVSLPIPQAKQDVPVYVNIIYLSQQPRQVKLGLSVSSNADIKELKQLLAADTGIEENDILLTEIDGEGFHRTFTETQLVSALSNNEALYCIEAPQVREMNENDGAFLMITWTNITVNEESTRIRFGSTFVTNIARETGFVDLQKVLIKEMASILQPGILVAEQKDPVFSIRILDGSPEGSLVDPLVEHPLYMESVDHALSLCDEDVPPHIKMHLEWTAVDKERIVSDDSESVEEHSSVLQTRQKHSEETSGSVTLGECFDLYTTAEQLSAEDAWHCPHCNRKEQGTLKMIGLWTAPQVLVVHLKRFRQAAKGRVAAMKISSVVDFPIEGLDLGPHVAKRSKSVENGLQNGGLNQASSPINGCFGIGNWKHRASFKKQLVSSATNHKNASVNVQNGGEDSLVYDLYAVCNHHGKDVLGGHYTAYCKNPVDSTWWSFDDTRVATLTSSEIKTASAYILFYTKRNGSVVNSQTLASQQQAQHWCRNLLKKYHKIPSLSTSNSVNGDSLLRNKATSRHVQRSGSPIANTNGGSIPIKDSKDPTINEVEISSTNALLANGYHNPSNTTNTSNISSAPLARMEDIGGIDSILGLGQKKLQIESTV